MSPQQNRSDRDSPPRAGEGLDAARKRGVRRTVVWLTLLALAIYIGFIALGVFRGS